MRTLLALALLLLTAGCVHAPKPLDAAQLAQLQATQDGFVSGEIGELGDYALMDNRDFTYSIAFSRDSKRAAYSHLAAHVYQVGVWDLGPPAAKVSNFPTNPNEFDTESLDFSPDKTVVVTASRDGVVRFFNAADGTPAGSYPTEEPLVSVAFHPNGRYVVAGSARGLITVIRYPDLAFAFELRAHEGEVRAFAFSDSGVLYSGGWDKSIVPFDAVEEMVPVSQTRMHFEKRGAFASVRGAIDGKASAAFAIDQRAPYVLINTQLAKTAGIDVAFLKDTATVPTPMGNQLVKIAKGHTLQFKAMSLRNVDLAVCDTCVPAEVQGVLGQPFSDAVDIAFDEAAKEVQLTLKTPTTETAPLLTLKPRTRLTFPWYVNDFSIDRAGKRLGVAFSETPAQRNREIYEREKKKLVEPTAEGNCAAIVDAQSGAVLKKWTKHNGVVSTVGISPDGQRLASGGWDKKLFILQEGELNPKIRREFGWSVRRVRFSRDGRFLALAAWTPQNPLGDQTSDPAAVIYEVLYSKPEFRAP
ncbi:MAG: WD40 repeat domain-containing protein [Myxococcaceae bacterium]